MRFDSFSLSKENVPMTKEESLESKVLRLEAELLKKSEDLNIYRKELTRANQVLSEMIQQSRDQVQQALKIQELLVPTEFPNISGFEFSTKYQSGLRSGSDYFDIFEHSDNMRFGIFMSSASGYGISSVLLSVLMKLTVEIEDRRGQDPSMVLQEIGKELSQRAQANDEVAVFYGVFDRRTYNLTYVNLGQELVLYHKASSQSIELLQGSGQCFKDLKMPEITNGVQTLEPNDKVILCSRGFLQLENAEGEKWGIQNIVSIVKAFGMESVHELRNEVFFQAQKFSAGDFADLTVVVSEVKNRVIKLATSP